MPIPPVPKPDCICGHSEACHWAEVRHTKSPPNTYRLKKGRCAAPVCACGKYQPHHKRGTRRSIRKYGIAAQREWAVAAGFAVREGHGADSLYYGPDGAALLANEHKQQARFPWGQVEDAMQQVESYCKTERGAPLPCVGYTTKPKSGRPARRYLIVRAEDWQRIAERLGGER